MSYDYRNFKVFLSPQVVTWNNSGAGTVALAYASDVPTLNHTAAADTPVLRFNVAKSIRAELQIPANTAMKIKNITYGYSIATLAITTHTAEAHKLTLAPSTGLVTAATVALTGTLTTAITTGSAVALTPASPILVTAYDDVILEVTPVCAATSVYKVTSIVVDVDIIDA